MQCTRNRPAKAGLCKNDACLKNRLRSSLVAKLKMALARAGLTKMEIQIDQHHKKTHMLAHVSVNDIS